MADKKRILIIDDDQLVRDLYTAIAERLGAEAVTVGTAKDARAKLKEETRFDLILMDLILPHENGWEFLDKLNLDASTAGIPVIIITGASLSQKEVDKLLRRTSAVVQKGTFELGKFRKLIDDSL